METSETDVTADQHMLEQHRKYIQDTFAKNADLPIKLSAVKIQDTDSVRESVLNGYLEATIYKAKTFRDLCQESDRLTKKLVQHEIAENVMQSFDSDGLKGHSLIDYSFPGSVRESRIDVNKISVLDIKSTIKLVPIKRIMAKTGTNIGNGEGDGYLQFQLKNMFGGGESLKLNVTKGTKTHSSYLLEYNQPVSPNWILTSTGMKNSRQFGALADLTFFSLRNSLKGILDKYDQIQHEIYTEATLRETRIIAPNCSDFLLFQAGNDQKITFGHTIAFDTRNNHVLPEFGILFKLNNEVSLNNYFKSAIELSSSRSWFDNNFITMTSSFRTGFMHNNQHPHKPLHFTDRFHLGGSNDIRGFELMGLGPKNINNPLGGNAFISYGLSVFSRLPFKKVTDSNFRLHWFLNGGKLIFSDTSSTLNKIRLLSNEHSIASGLGLVYKHPLARFELNFTLPLVSHSDDTVRKGFQYGLGMSFL